MEGQPRFKSIERTIVANEAINTIRSMILAGELQAHQRLPPERELAEMLGVSRPTLREAVRALTVLNILESRHGEGTFVTSLDPVLLAEPIDFVLRVDPSVVYSLTEARSFLEVGGAGLAAERITAEELEELEGLATAYERAVDDVEACIALDAEFHRRVVRSSRNLILISFLESLNALSLESRHQTARNPGRRRETIGYHRRLIAALRAQDVDQARKIMLVHLQDVARALKEETGKPPDTSSLV
jgi:GntR family transcriptional repressor for pyruvate dehydrogenase complex